MLARFLKKKRNTQRIFNFTNRTLPRGIRFLAKTCGQGCPRSGSSRPFQFYKQCYTIFIIAQHKCARAKTMNIFTTSKLPSEEIPQEPRRFFKYLNLVINNVLVGALTCIIFYLSIIATSLPTLDHDRVAVKRAINLLEQKGFNREVFLLKRVVSFRSTDNWLNGLNHSEDAYAATNFPFAVITVYPDFYSKAADDTERAMILLHEAQHLEGKTEEQAYSYVWQNRKRLGWTQLSHGTTPAYITIADQTREYAPKLFTCKEKFYNDCTEEFFVKTTIAASK